MEECGLDYKDPNFSEERMIAVFKAVAADRDVHF